ncbi:MAG: type III-B CRISPR-associated protein Cas10/Cmr2, partial [Candidatus Diapherotrites archaeon]|nr:type III-B CRISPR-associated protein Cas10/Cmr2 [Candidatus Diapherotrites archaeon]
NFAEKILRYDGEWLFPETYDRKIVEAAQHPQKQQGLREAQRAAQTIIRVARELGLKPPRPTPYYAILFVDGDRMGRQIRKAATDGPEKHKAISEALADFATKDVYRIIETTYSGRVVYAGGDDVVALLPLPTALPAAKALRRKYAEKMAGVLETPTMSAGIAMVHHLSPLSEALKAARQAEHTAKERYKRNAIAVAFHKRGGAPVMMGASWEFGDSHQATIDLLLDIQRRFAVADDPSKEIGLSLGLAHTLLDEARFLGGDVPMEASQAEVERLLYRAAPGHLPRKVRYEQAQRLAPLLVQLAEAIEKSLKAKEQRCNGSHRALESGLVIVAQWLLLLRFIVQESGAPVMMEEETQ